MNSFVSQNKPGLDAGSPPLCLLLIVVNLSEVRPAISHHPATPDRAAADLGDRKLDTTGTTPFPLLWAPGGTCLQGTLRSAYFAQGHWEQRDSDSTVVGPVLPDWVAHHFCESGLICLYSELVCFLFFFFFFNKGESF